MIGSTVSVSCLLVLLVIDCVFGQENTTLVPEVTPETTQYNWETTTSSGNGPYHSPIFPEDDDPPSNNDTDPAIILGQRAGLGEIPYQAYLFSHRQNSNSGSVCGGSLIRTTWVLTAAHCVTGSDQTLVHLGHTNRNSMPYRQYANLRIVHEAYNPNNLNNDLALLRLPVAAQGNTIAVILLAPPNWTNLNRVGVRASGFGKTSNTGPTVDDLMKVNLIGITNEQCRNTYGSTIIASTLCATWSTQSGQSTCNGDSGGPLTAVSGNQHYLVGVTSFVVRNACDGGHPSGYARVTSFRNWIDNNIARYS